VGKGELIEKLIIALISGGHVLLEDVPGVGKTSLAKALADSVALSFSRIQCTPDTMPGDITGVSIYNAKTGEFEVVPGPVMNNIVLADELNRTTPKTQSALLEAMEEKKVTIDGNDLKLPEPFMVIGTQNPLETAGTYPLPEAQLDRFMMKLSIGYPDKESEIELTKLSLEGKVASQVEAVCSAEDIVSMKREAAAVHISESIYDYIRDIIAITRTEENFVMGASPRATIFLASAARSHAYLDGRDFVKPDDVKAVCVNTLHHRLALTSQARIKNENIDSLIKTLMLRVKVPID
jgi:MoxR-like ATPase